MLLFSNLQKKENINKAILNLPPLGVAVIMNGNGKMTWPMLFAQMKMWLMCQKQNTRHTIEKLQIELQKYNMW